MEFDRTPSSWVWSDGSAMNYTAWAPGQPNNFFRGERLCIRSINTEQGPGAATWDDHNCMHNAANFLVCKMFVS